MTAILQAAVRHRLAAHYAQHGHPAQLASLLRPDAYRRRAHTDLISATVADAVRGTGPRWTMIACPPQSGKTHTGVVWAAAWALIRDPTTRIIIVSYSDQLARERSKDIRRIISAHRAVLGIDVERGSDQAAYWRTTAGGSVLSVGLRGGATGHPARMVLMDDLVKSGREASSLTYQIDTYEAVSSEYISRLEPDGVMLWPSTWWHPLDPSQRLIRSHGTVEDGGMWHVLRLPAICDGPGDPLGRSEGDPLPHPNIDENNLDALLAHWNRRRVTARPAQWQALYQAKPVMGEGSLLTLEQLEAARSEIPAKVRLTWVAVDPTVWDDPDEESSSRAECGILCGVLGDDGNLYVTADRTALLSVHEWPARVCAVAESTKASRILIEGNNGGGALRTLVHTAWDSQPRSVRRPIVKVVMVHVGKGDRAVLTSSMITSGRLRTAASLPAYEAEWASWRPESSRAADSPGRIDAAGLACHVLLPVQSRPDRTERGTPFTTRRLTRPLH